ncbi:MAG: TonB-dependent receptor [Gammaproteobacteria bacterium]
MRNHQLRLAVRAVLAAGALATAVAAPTAFAQEEAADLERVQVTGSRIKRTDIEGALPVTVIDRETIELSGKTSVADLLRNQPMNTQGSFRPQSGSTGQSFAGLSLRGLGAGRTLILIDGRRAPVAPNIGSGQDLNSIPLAAVERIEILSDGASAIYGSDAIGGVVNIITRRDFTGAELMVGGSDPKRKGGDTREASAVFGAAGQNGQIMVGVSHNKRDIIFQRDREWSAGGASSFGNNFLRQRFTPDGDPVGNAGFLQHPQFGAAVAAGCQDEGFLPTNIGTTSGRCFYDFTLQAADEAEIDNQSLFARARYDINMDWSVGMNAQVNRVKSFGRYAPVPSSPWLVGGFGAIVVPAGSPNHPGTRPEDGGLNPEWAAYQDPIIFQTDDGPVTHYTGPDQGLLLWHRFAANGPRDTNTDANVYDVDLFVEGRIGNYDLEFGVRRIESQYYDLGRNYIVSALAQPQFNSGAYNIYDPTGTPDDVLNSFTATINRDARFVSREYRGLISGDLMDIQAGTIGFAFGAEYRDEDYRDIFDDLQANGNITGSAGNSAFGDRDQWAVFGELLVPVLPDLELSFAGRYDDYSDFGDNFSPKVALRWQPMDELTVRASWGEGFRAPPLDILAQQPSFSAASVVHVPTAEFFGNENPNAAIQITTFSIANPNLGAEQSEQFSLGVAFEPLDWLNGSVDYWNIKVTDRVAGISAQRVLNCLSDSPPGNCPPGLRLFPAGSTGPNPSLGLGVLFGDQGQVDFLQSGFASLGKIETDGVDLNLKTNFDFGGAGRLSNELVATYVNSVKVDGGSNFVGEANVPEWRAILRNVYTWGDFSAAWNINYIDSQSDSFADPDVGLSSWTTHDLQVNYFTPWNSRVTIGADNLFDKDPVLDDGESRGFNFGLYNGYGRIVYARYTQSF